MCVCCLTRRQIRSVDGFCRWRGGREWGAEWDCADRRCRRREQPAVGRCFVLCRCNCAFDHTVWCAGRSIRVAERLCRAVRWVRPTHEVVLENRRLSADRQGVAAALLVGRLRPRAGVLVCVWWRGRCPLSVANLWVSEGERSNLPWSECGGIKNRKGCHHDNHNPLNLKSNTMKNTMQRYDLFWNYKHKSAIFFAF